MEHTALGLLDAAAVEQSWSVVPRRSTMVQCAACGSPDVVGICHHCHQYLCADHVAHPGVHQQGSWEFKTLIDPPLWSRAVHCAQDAHFVFAYRRMIVLPASIVLVIMLVYLLGALARVGGLLSVVYGSPLTYLVWVTWILDNWFRGQSGIVLELALAYVGPVILSLCGFIISLAVVIIGERLYQQRGIPALEGEGQPLMDIPYIPEYYKVDLEETVDITFQAEAGCLTCDDMTGSGRVRIHALRNAHPSRSSDAYNERARKRHWEFQRLPNWDLGYAALDPPPGISWSSPAQGEGLAANIVRLRSWDNQALSAPEAKWAALSFDERYSLPREVLYPGDGMDRRPFLRVLPVLQPLGAGRTVQLLFDLAPSLGATKWVLTHLMVAVPTGAFVEADTSWPVEETNGFADSNLMQVRWKHWPLTRALHIPPSITFTAPIPSLRYPLTLRFELEGDRALSHPEFAGGRVWLPTGAAADSLQMIRRHTTLIRGEALIDPALLSYQCELATQPITRIVLNVALTPAVLSQLLARLARDEMTVYAVTQNSDTISPLEGQRVLSWDIWGRRYEHIYPMDFHILLSDRVPLNGHKSELSFTVTGRVLMNSQFVDLEGHVQDFAGEISKLVYEELLNGG